MVATLILAIFLASLFIYVVGNHPKFAVQFSVLTVVLGTFIAFLVVGAETGNWGAALLVVAIPSVLILLWYACVRKRIPFAASVLSVACEVLSVNRKLYALSFVGIVSWTLTFFVTSLAYGGVRQKVDNNGIALLFILSLFWTTAVFANVIHTTIAGVVGTWWAIANPVDPVWKSLKRSCTTSFGSICFVSFLLSLLNLARVICRVGAEGDSSLGRGFLNCCSCIGRWMRVSYLHYMTYG